MRASITLTIVCFVLLSIAAWLTVELVEKNKERQLALSVHLQNQITALEERVWTNEKVIKAYAEGRKKK